MISNHLPIKSVALIVALNFMYVYGFTCIAFDEKRLVNVTVEEEIDRVLRPTKFTDNPFTVLELLEGKKVTNSDQVDKIILDIFWGETNSTSDGCIQIEDLVEFDENLTITRNVHLPVATIAPILINGSSTLMSASLEDDESSCSNRSCAANNFGWYWPSFDYNVLEQKWAILMLAKKFLQNSVDHINKN